MATGVTNRRYDYRMATVTVYTQPNCVQCYYTKQLLDRNRVPYNTIDITGKSDVSTMLRDRGFATLPVVKVERGNQVEWWTGFKIEKIRGLAVLLKGEEDESPRDTT